MQKKNENEILKSLLVQKDQLEKSEELLHKIKVQTNAISTIRKKK